ncbi:MAG: DNA mismatch repair protein MutS [Bacteroidales bacterium]|jgi:DNA mismatch repair ATPase MutS|nr:DNA mismatch repair protein MutS [Bacteroidales bacterium]
MQLKSVISEISGLQFMVENLDLKSSVGKRFLLDTYIMQSANQINTELELVEKALHIINHKENSSLIDKLQTRLLHIRDINGSIRNVGNDIILDDIELFEIKSFAMIVQEIISLCNKYDQNIIDIPDLSGIVNVLDPDKTNIPSFYIYDSYSEPLAQLRRDIKKLKSEEFDDQEEKNRKLDTLLTKAEKFEFEVRVDLCKEIKRDHSNLEKALHNIAHLDIIISKALQANRYELCRPQVSEDVTEYKALFNPEIKDNLKNQRRTYQPIDIKLNKSVCFITGANMAGKTVILKTIALSQYLTQFGFFVPAKEASVTIVDKVMISIGDEQSEHNGLSSFASEMVKIDKMVQEAQKKSNVLILIDELARTTNPVEGRAIVNAVANILYENNIRSLITTHYSGLSSQCRKLRVKGLDKDIKAGEINRDNINNYIDYSLIEDEVGVTPHEALRIAQMLGINEQIISKAQTELMVISDKVTDR